MEHSEPVLSIALVLQRRDRNEDTPKDEGSGKQTMDGHIQRMRCETLTKRAQQSGEVDKRRPILKRRRVLRESEGTDESGREWEKIPMIETSGREGGTD